MSELAVDRLAEPVFVGAADLFRGAGSAQLSPHASEPDEEMGLESAQGQIGKGIDGGDASTGNEAGILDLGHAVVDPLEVIYDGGTAVSN